ncbi:hypothetical protein [Lysobacter cavernae]|uniref:hypothetical protein n=1 Tax=Lysobacter cavernae TaxID=1685901 RepID=UPI0036D77831
MKADTSCCDAALSGFLPHLLPGPRGWVTAPYSATLANRESEQAREFGMSRAQMPLRLI